MKINQETMKMELKKKNINNIQEKIIIVVFKDKSKEMVI